MKTLAFAAALAATAFASPAFAQACEANCPINVSFAEAASDDDNNPAPTVTGTDAYTSTADGEKTSVTLTNYFANSEFQSIGATSVYNLMEGMGESAAISDQITFMASGNDLVIGLISDPAKFLSGENVYVLGSAVETGSVQTIFDSSLLQNFPFQPLTVSAASEAETGPVPEPATWAMMLLGFGGIGFEMRRKNRAALATA